MGVKLLVCTDENQNLGELRPKQRKKIKRDGEI